MTTRRLGSCYLIILLIFISCFRYSSDDPLWHEVAKRYQQIIEKEFKLLDQFPVYYDGQMIPLTTPVKVTVNAPPSLKKGGKQKGTSTCKSSEKYTETRSFPINEYAYSSMLTEKMEDHNLPKIVEVYSLNSLKSNGQESGLKGDNQGGLSCKNKETSNTKSDMSTKQPSKSLLQDANTCTHSSQMKPYLVPDNFIDLTIDEEEETKSCSVDDRSLTGLLGEDMNAGNQSEFDQPREDTGDNARQSKKSNQRKRKGVFGNRRKGKSRCPAQNQQRNTNKSLNTGWDWSGCNSDNIIQGDQDKTQYRAFNDQHCSYQGKGEQKLNDLNNNNDWRKEDKNNSAETTDGRKEHWNGSRINGGVNISLDMTYRDNKITTLKARLAKQEEELARLRTQKESKIAKVRSLEAPHQDVGQEQMESEANDLSIRNHEKQEEEEADPVEVNLDDICQHVIKSFDIFNARQLKDKTRRTEGFHTLYEENTGIIKQAKSDVNDLAYLPQGRQEEFLFQIGLRRRKPSDT